MGESISGRLNEERDEEGEVAMFEGDGQWQGDDSMSIGSLVSGRKGASLEMSPCLEKRKTIYSFSVDLKSFSN